MTTCHEVLSATIRRNILVCGALKKCATHQGILTDDCRFNCQQPGWRGSIHLRKWRWK